MMKVTDILNGLIESGDFCRGVRVGTEYEDDDRTELWMEIIRDKSADSGFGYLVDSILEHGFDKDSTIGYDVDHGYMSNGHHRMVAAILLGLDEVPVSDYGSNIDKYEECLTAHYVKGPRPNSPIAVDI